MNTGERAQQTARRLINQYGSTVTITPQTHQAYDPATSAATTAEAAAYKVKSLISPLKKTSDRGAAAYAANTMVKTNMLEFTLAGLDAPTVKSGDSILFNGSDYVVTMVVPEVVQDVLVMNYVRGEK